MAAPSCPNCARPVLPTDTQCLECGAALRPAAAAPPRAVAPATPGQPPPCALCGRAPAQVRADVVATRDFRSVRLLRDDPSFGEQAARLALGVAVGVAATAAEQAIEAAMGAEMAFNATGAAMAAATARDPATVDRQHHVRERRLTIGLCQGCSARAASLAKPLARYKQFRVAALAWAIVAGTTALIAGLVLLAVNPVAGVLVLLFGSALAVGPLLYVRSSVTRQASGLRDSLLRVRQVQVLVDVLRDWTRLTKLGGRSRDREMQTFDHAEAKAALCLALPNVVVDLTPIMPLR